MDPFSLTVGSFALLGAVVKVSAGVRKLAALKHAPAILLQLENDVSNLQRLVAEVYNILQDAQTIGARASEHLEEALKRAKLVVLELQEDIEYRLTKPSENSRISINKSKWLRSGRSIATYRVTISQAISGIEGAMIINNA